MVDNLGKLISAVEIELKKAEIAYKNAKKSALEIAASAAASPSQAGDRFHSQGTADLAKERYQTVLAFKNEVNMKGEKIFFEYEGKNIVLVDNPVMISGFIIASTQSPVGKMILSR